MLGLRALARDRGPRLSLWAVSVFDIVSCPARCTGSACDLESQKLSTRPCIPVEIFWCTGQQQEANHWNIDPQNQLGQNALNRRSDAACCKTLTLSARPYHDHHVDFTRLPFLPHSNSYHHHATISTGGGENYGSYSWYSQWVPWQLSYFTRIPSKQRRREGIKAGKPYSLSGLSMYSSCWSISILKDLHPWWTNAFFRNYLGSFPEGGSRTGLDRLQRWGSSSPRLEGPSNNPFFQ